MIYQLYDISHGHGWTQNAYIGLGIPIGTDGSLQLNGCRVFKHGWDDMGHSSSELDILRHIFDNNDGKKWCTAGIVQPNLPQDASGL